MNLASDLLCEEAAGLATLQDNLISACTVLTDPLHKATNAKFAGQGGGRARLPLLAELFFSCNSFSGTSLLSTSLISCWSAVVARLCMSRPSTSLLRNLVQSSSNFALCSTRKRRYPSLSSTVVSTRSSLCSVLVTRVSRSLNGLFEHAAT